METIELAELHRRMKAQGVSGREHVAFRCVVCGTIQSVASLMRAGAAVEAAERAIGFSCEGRFNGAGPWPRDPTKRAARTIRGCDWTLGGLFTIHEVEVLHEDGRRSPVFALATPEEAQALERGAA